MTTFARRLRPKPAEAARTCGRRRRMRAVEEAERETPTARKDRTTERAVINCPG